MNGTAVPVCALHQDRSRYDLQLLWTHGITTDVRRKRSWRLRPYTIAQLKDPQPGTTCFVRLFFWGHRDFLQPGRTVRVLGRYFRNFTTTPRAFAHEIQPIEVVMGGAEPTEREMDGARWILTADDWVRAN